MILISLFNINYFEKEYCYYKDSLSSHLEHHIVNIHSK
jgi:hypothetical protein